MPRPIEPFVLVAEDHPLNQKVMKLMLKSLSVEYLVVNNGLEAVAVAREGGVSLILMDIMMPELDGFQASLQIRKIEFKAGRHTPIVACTALEEDKVFEEAIRCGIDGYLPKLISKTSLKNVIEHWTRTEITVAQMSNSSLEELQTIQQSADREPIDENELRLLYGFEQLDDIVALFLTITRTLMAQLDSAIQNHDLDLIKRAATEIRGSSFAVSAREMALLCLDLENASERENWSEVVKIYAALGLAFARVRQLNQDKPAIIEFRQAG